MLNLLVLLVSTCSIGCAGRPRAEAAEPVRLTVLTYNIHHAAGMDERLDLERIANVIRRCEADLVALQEVDAGTRRADHIMQATELGRLAHMHHAYGPAMEFDGGKYGNAVLSRYPIVDSQTIPLPHNPGGQREPRSAIATTIDLASAGRIVFISTHLDHTRSQSDRFEQARALNAHFGEANQHPAILAGDFNCEPGSEPMAELTQHWTLVSSDRTGPSTQATFSSTQPRINIDHVLVKPRDRWRVVETRVIDEPVASDHRPVVVVLELKPGD